MLLKQFPLRVKFIIGFIYSEEKIYVKSREIMRNKFGEIDFESEIINFDFTNYYYKEMGAPLFRRFISFRKLVGADRLLGMKSFCIKVERKFAEGNRRKINIDPGYLNEAKLVLTTTKDFHHRIYLGKGVYAEVTLYYRNGDYCDFPTTYPDYRTPEYKKIFLQMRDAYHRQIH